MRKLVAGVLLGLATAAFVLLIGWAGFLDVVELKAYDWRVRQRADPAAVHPDIVIVEINDASIRDLAGLVGRWPWPRVTLAGALDFLSRAPAKVIAVDLTILEPDTRLLFQYGDDKLSGTESDAALVDSVAAAQNVVLLGDAVYRGVEGGDGSQRAVESWTSPPFKLGAAIEERPLLVPPFPSLYDAAHALGHNLLTIDRDGPARRFAPFISVGGRYVPSLGVAAALQALDLPPSDVVLEGDYIRVGNRRVPLVSAGVRGIDSTKTDGRGAKMLVNYRAPRLAAGRRAYTAYEFRHVLFSEEALRAGETPMLDPALFRNKVVFIGLSASGLLDIFPTPFDDLMPGVHLHARVADSILSDRFIRPGSDRTRLATTLALTLAVAVMASALPFIAAAAGALIAVCGWIWTSLHVFGGGVWLDMTTPLVGMAIAMFAGTAYQYFVEGAEKRAVKKLFGRYVSKDVYQQLVANPALAELGGKRREMTVLFSDIRGFTSVTEKGDPEALVAQLNEYFSRMVEIIFRHQGTVDKFVGDLVMALFGAPLDDPRHASHAVAAAVDMVAALGELNRKWASEGRAVLDIGVGVNSGEMIAGNIGSSSIMSYTVIGDNVNLGSRLESLNKDFHSRIIISDATRTRLSEQYDLRSLGEVVVKGKTRPVAIFEVVVPTPLSRPRK